MRVCHKGEGIRLCNTLHFSHRVSLDASFLCGTHWFVSSLSVVLEGYYTTQGFLAYSTGLKSTIRVDFNAFVGSKISLIPTKSMTGRISAASTTLVKSCMLMRSFSW